MLGYDLSQAAIDNNSFRELLFHTDDDVSRTSNNICESPDNFGIISGVLEENSRVCAVAEWGHYVLEDVSGIAPEIALNSPDATTVLIGGTTTQFEVTASDDVGVAAVYMIVNGAIVNEIEQAPYTFNYTVPFTVEPILNIEFVAVDFGDRTSTTGNNIYAARADSDQDGLFDDDELNVYGTDPNNPDTDGDGVDDGEEIALGIDPLNSDTDGDGVSDGTEIAHGLNPNDSTDVAADTDSDGLTNGEEVDLSSNPFFKDTDFDSLEDGEEVQLGKNVTLNDFGFNITSQTSTSCGLRNNQIHCWGNDVNITNIGSIPLVVNATKVVVGTGFACVLDGGEIKCWGSNGSFSRVSDSTRVNGLLGRVIDLDVGRDHGCGLDDTGAIACWGRAGAESNPKVIVNARQITAGDRFSYGLGDDGVKCWGDSGNDKTAVPSDLVNPKYINSGQSHTCAIDDTGVRCWGRNIGGESSDQTGFANVKYVQASGSTSCAIDDFGIRCWGTNGNGQRNVPSLSNPRQIALGDAHACALSDAGVTCWGLLDGRLVVPEPLSVSLDLDGDGLDDDWEVRFGLSPLDASDANSDEDGDGLTALQEFAAGRVPNDRDEDGISNADEIALGYDIDNPDQDADNILDGWELDHGLDPINSADGLFDPDGDNLDNENEFMSRADPFFKDSDFDSLEDGEEVQLGSDVTENDFGYSLSARAGTTCGIRDQAVYCWGNDTNITNAASIPVVTKPTKVTVGAEFACVLDDGEIKCWGSNGSHNRVSDASRVDVILGRVIDIDVGFNHGCALDDSGTIGCWGRNVQGERNPKIIVNPRQVTAGDNFSCGLGDDGVKCWGEPDNGKTAVPSDLLNPKYISSGLRHSCVIDDTGVRCWGLNSVGQSVDQTGFSDPKRLETSSSGTCAIDDTGIRCWGRNNDGELSLPVLSHPRQLELGSNHACALSDEGVTCWGLADGRIVPPTELAAPLDTDGDGVSDTDEYSIGSNPFQP